MTQEEKQLLLKDLCARLPYDTLIKEEYGDYINVNLHNANIEHLIDRISEGLDKLVLRSMSSMAEEEKEEYIKVASFDLQETVNGRHYEYYYTSYVGSEDGELLPDYDAIDWLNSHHFDYRGLIEKGLAIEAPEGMYNF